MDEVRQLGAVLLCLLPVEKGPGPAVHGLGVLHHLVLDCDVEEELAGAPVVVAGGEQVPGGVSRNVVEDIANVELRPTFVSLVDDTGMGQDVIDKLRDHKVNTQFIRRVKDGMGTWLAIFDNDGDVHAAISKRPDTNPLTDLLAENGWADIECRKDYGGNDRCILARRSYP